MTGVVMWEARAATGRLAALTVWVDDQADPSATVFSSAEPDPRVVCVDPTGRGLPEPPAELVARPPHAWTFDAVARRRTAP